MRWQRSIPSAVVFVMHAYLFAGTPRHGLRCMVYVPHMVFDSSTVHFAERSLQVGGYVSDCGFKAKTHGAKLCYGPWESAAQQQTGAADSIRGRVPYSQRERIGRQMDASHADLHLLCRVLPCAADGRSGGWRHGHDCRQQFCVSSNHHHRCATYQYVSDCVRMPPK